MFKNKFVTNPQHDSEGFVQLDARCRGCAPEDPCPRSGHCERYSSPLRIMGNGGVTDKGNRVGMDLMSETTEQPLPPLSERECATRLRNCGGRMCQPKCFLLRQEGWHWDDDRRELVKDEPTPECSEQDKTIARVVLAGWQLVPIAMPSGGTKYMILSPRGSIHGYATTRYTAAWRAEMFIADGVL